MKTIGTYIRAFFSLGRLGLVMLLLAFAMLLAAVSQISDPFDAAFERMYVLSILETEITFDLVEIQIQEAQELFTLTYGLPSSGGFEKAAQADDRISQTMAGLDEEESFDGEYYSTDLSEEVQAFAETRAAHRALFESTVNNFDEMDDYTWYEALNELEYDNEFLNWSLGNLIIPIEHDRLLALQDFPEDANLSILHLVISMALCLILALIGYQVIASTVRPLRHMNNTITAIAGDMYHPGASPKGNAISSGLSKALEELARAEQARNENIKKEIEELRQSLYESRRRRLKIHQPAQKTE